MAYIISAITLIGSFIKKNNKIIFALLILLMIVLFGWSNKTADWNIYLNRYYNYASSTQTDEPIFSLIMKIFNLANLEFREFLIIIAIIIITLYAIFIRKATNKANFVLALYFIFPFIIEVSQIRFAMSSVIAVIGILGITKKVCSKKDYIVYFICCIVAGMIHYASLFSLIFIIAKKIDINKLIVISICMILIFTLFIFATDKIINIKGNTSWANKVNFIITMNEDVSINRMINAISRMIIFFVFYAILNRIVSKKITQIEGVNEQKVYFNNLVLKFNIIVLILIPITFYSPDIYRVQQMLSILNYLTYALYFKEGNLIHNGRIKKDELIFTILCIINAITNLYVLVLNNNNINTVFYSLFNNNILLH